MAFERGHEVAAARDIPLGLDVVIRSGCPGRVLQRIGSLVPKYTVRFLSRNDHVQNKLVVRDLIDADLKTCAEIPNPQVAPRTVPNPRG